MKTVIQSLRLDPIGSFSLQVFQGNFRHMMYIHWKETCPMLLLWMLSVLLNYIRAGTSKSALRKIKGRIGSSSHGGGGHDGPAPVGRRHRCKGGFAGKISEERSRNHCNLEGEKNANRRMLSLIRVLAVEED